MNPIVLQAFFAVFNFVLIAWVLYKFAGPMVTRELKARNEANRQALEKAEAAQAEAARELAAFRTRLANVEGELSGIVANARTMAAQVAKDVETTAATDAERLREHAKLEVQRERTLAQQTIRVTMLRRALAEAEAELKRQMNADLQQQLVSRFIQKVGDGSCPIKL